MNIIGLYRLEKKLTAPDTNDLTFDGPAVKRGQLVELTHLSVVDYTTGAKQLSVGKKDAHDAKHYVSSVNKTGHRETHMNGHLILLENEKPCGEVLSPTEGDEIYFTAHGLVYEYPGG